MQKRRDNVTKVRRSKRLADCEDWEDWEDWEWRSCRPTRQSDLRTDSFCVCDRKGKKNAGDSRGGQGNVELIQVIEGEIEDGHTDRFFISEMKEPVN